MKNLHFLAGLKRNVIFFLFLFLFSSIFFLQYSQIKTTLAETDYAYGLTPGYGLEPAPDFLVNKIRYYEKWYDEQNSDYIYDRIVVDICNAGNIDFYPTGNEILFSMETNDGRSGRTGALVAIPIKSAKCVEYELYQLNMLEALTYTVTLDPDGVISELNEENNAYTRTVTPVRDETKSRYEGELIKANTYNGIFFIENNLKRLVDPQLDNDYFESYWEAIMESNSFSISDVITITNDEYNELENGEAYLIKSNTKHILFGPTDFKTYVSLSQGKLTKVDQPYLDENGYVSAKIARPAKVYFDKYEIEENEKIFDLGIESISVKRPEESSNGRNQIVVNVYNNGTETINPDNDLVVTYGTNRDDVESCAIYNCFGKGNVYSASIRINAYGKTELARAEEYSITFDDSTYLLDDVVFEEGVKYYFAAVINSSDSYADTAVYNNIKFFSTTPLPNSSEGEVNYEGKLIAMEGLNSIYHLKDGKRMIASDGGNDASWQSYFAKVMDSNELYLNDVEVVPQQVLESYPLGKYYILNYEKKYAIKKESNSSVYAMIGGEDIQAIQNEADFLALGYSFAEIVIVPDAFFEHYDIVPGFLELDYNDLAPDLIVESINFSADTKGEKGVISVTIKNIGDAHYNSNGLLNFSHNFSEQMFTWSNEDINGVAGEYETDRDLPTVTKPLGNNESITFSWYGYFDTSGPLYIRFATDFTNQLDEANENNNTLSTIINIGDADSSPGLPDLVIHGVHLPSSNDLSFTVEVANHGDTETSFPDGIKVSASVRNSNNALVEVSDSGYKYIDNLKPNTLGSAKFYILDEVTDEIQLTIWIDNSESSSIGFVRESNEDNNKFVKNIFLGEKEEYVENDSEENSGNEELKEEIRKLKEQVLALERKLTVLDQKFAEKYSGTMFLDVENHGRLWYVDPVSKKRYYFQNGESALEIGSRLATGITYEDIQKIPVGVPEKLYNLKDSDGDGLPDRLESALGSDKDKKDSDGDGFEDGSEVSRGYSPLNEDKYNYNSSLIKRFEGKMLLQVSGPNSHGEIWYIKDGKRWYGGTQDSMYEIMKARSLGAVPDDIRKIEVAEQ